MIGEAKALFYQFRSTSEVLKDGFLLYLRHFGCLTRPLLYPLLAQAIGVVLWLGLSYLGTDFLVNRFHSASIWLLWSLFILANLPGMLLFFYGVWEYLLWVAGLSLVTRACAETGQCPDLVGARLRIATRVTDYSLIWSFLFALLFIPLGIAVLPIALLPVSHLGYTIAGILLLLGVLVSLTLLLFFSLVFQVFAFTPGPAGACLLRSVTLVSRGAFKALVVSAVMLAVTQFVLPFLLVWIAEWIHLVSLLAQGIAWGIHEVIPKPVSQIREMQAHYPLVALLVSLLRTQTPEVSMVLSQLILYSLFSALVLPLGIVWLSLLYADLKLRQDRANPGILNPK